MLLHGNPAVDVYNGLKLSAGGELGIGVGEEEWGSGEREVLEGFIGRTKGLVDMVVSRFGFPLHGATDPNSENELSGGFGAGEYPGPSDGVVFSGTGALTRPSIRNVSSWMEWLYMHGETAYGVRDNPSSLRRTRTKRERQLNSENKPSLNDCTPADIPAPIVPPSSTQRKRSGDFGPPDVRATSEKRPVAPKASAGENFAAGTDTFVKYLTLGVYGSQWGIPSGRPPVNERLSNLRGDSEKSPSSGSGGFSSEPVPKPFKGYFMIGLLGELEEETHDDSPIQDTEGDTDREALSERGASNGRTVMRTVHVERRRATQTAAEDGSNDGVEQDYFDRLRIVVYVQEPFIFTFLFEMETDSLAIPSFYRSLHHQLGPLQRPLLISTSPSKVSERLWEAASPRSTDASKSTQPISDLVYDPARLTVHTSIPNIPEPAQSPTASTAVWTRVEAMTVHSQILNTYVLTRRHSSELERTCKTSRGWWVVWMRLPHAPTTSQTHSSSYREAFLIRRASDYVMPTPRKLRSRYTSSGLNDSAGWGGPNKLAEGIGIDARQYIEGLLSLNR